MKTTLIPYLNFNGNAAEAMKFYQSVLGGELHISTFGQSGMPDIPEEEKNRTVHASLVADGITIMASDGHVSQEIKFGDSVHLSLNGSDEELLTKWFNGLAEGGTIDMKLEKQFWGDIFGILTDKYGIHWMVNISAEQPSETEK